MAFFTLYKVSAATFLALSLPSNNILYTPGMFCSKADLRARIGSKVSCKT